MQLLNHALTSAFEDMAWVSNYTPYLYEDVIIQPCPSPNVGIKVKPC